MFFFDRFSFLSGRLCSRMLLISSKRMEALVIGVDAQTISTPPELKKKLS